MQSGIRNERGSTIALMAVCLFAMLAMGALAIDLAVIRDARGEAQRTADAIALAGASAFRDIPIPANAVGDAQKRALTYARRNQIGQDTVDIRPAVWTGNEDVTVPGAIIVDQIYNSTIPVRTITTNEVTLNIISHPDSQKVRAWVHRSGVRTFFAGMLARPYGHVTAMATAWASNAGPKVPCLKPFVIPDMWWESNKTTQDVNGNNYMEPNVTGPGNGQTGEIWKYEPASVGGQDYYHPFNPAVTPPPGQVQTGYGSGLQGGGGYPSDVGIPLLLKPQTGNGNGQPAPDRMGNAFWLLDLDPDRGVEDEIKFNCSEGVVGSNVPYEPGSHTGPTRKGVNYLIDQDPSAVWNQSTQTSR